MAGLAAIFRNPVRKLAGMVILMTGGTSETLPVELHSFLAINDCFPVTLVAGNSNMGTL